MRRFSRWRDDDDDDEDGGGSNPNPPCCEDSDGGGEEDDAEGGVKIMSRRMSMRGAFTKQERREPNEEGRVVMMV